MAIIRQGKARDAVRLRALNRARGEQMTSDRDVYAAALQLICKHGAEGAGFHAAQRADEMLAQGAHEGMRVWQRIMRAIDDLAAKEPPPGSIRH